MLRQHCPTSLSRTLVARRHAASEEHSVLALDFDTAPKKYVSLTLQISQGENACVNWILDKLDGRLMAMRKRLDLDSYFAVVDLLKERAAQSWPSGVLETLIYEYNGIGLYYAAHPEQSEEILTNALNQMDRRGNLSAQKHHVGAVSVRGVLLHEPHEICETGGTPVIPVSVEWKKRLCRPSRPASGRSLWVDESPTGTPNMDPSEFPRSRSPNLKSWIHSKTLS